MLDNIINWLSDHGIRILIIIVLGFIVDRIADSFADKTIAKFVENKQRDQNSNEIKKRAQTLSQVFNTTTTLIVTVIVMLMILPELGIEIAPLLAGVGIIGLAVGFGAQNLVRDFISGLFIIIEDQYAIGDVVKIGDKTGSVESLNLRRTVLRDLDGAQHYIPNSEIKTASNLTKDWSRIDLEVSVAYSADIEQVTRLLNRIGKDLTQDSKYKDFFIEAPEVLGIDELGKSEIIIKMLGKTKPLKQWEMTRELRKRIKLAFDENKITISSKQAIRK